MGARRMKTRCHEITTQAEDHAQVASRFLHSMLDALTAQDAEIARMAAEKVSTNQDSQETIALQIETGRACLRIVSDAAEGFAAVEYLSGHAGSAAADRWEAFVCSSQTGEGERRLLTGCRFQEAEGAHEPDAWLHAVQNLQLGQEIHPANQPDFLTLASAALANAGTITVHSDAHERVMLEAEIDQQREMLHEQSHRITSLLAALEAARAAGGTANTEATQPLTYADIGQWAADNAERIVILPRAIRGARSSVYENPQLVYDCLEFLADTYRLVRLGQRDRMENIERCSQMGVSIGGSVDKSNAGEAGEQYFVDWNKRRRFLDQHLGKGNIRDPRMCMRIYFTWCDDTQRVVVGSMTEHLNVGST